MIEAYKNNYDLYFKDQMTRFESYEGDLYKGGIAKTVEKVFNFYEQHLSVLDFCCGDGTASGMISKLGFYVDGFDGNVNKIKKATRDYPKCNFFYLDAKDIREIGDKYDIIYASHCFEHFLDPIGILKQATHLLEDEGEIVLILPYPNEESEGHPGSNILKLNESIKQVKNNFIKLGFTIVHLEEMNIREPELLIILK